MSAALQLQREVGDDRRSRYSNSSNEVAIKIYEWRAMQLPQMTTRSWMVVVAAVALMSWGIRWDGFRALVWEAPILAASLAIWMVKRKQQFAARVLGGAVLLWLIIVLAVPPIHVEMGVGQADVRISFVVLDADTGQP